MGRKLTTKQFPAVNITLPDVWLGAHLIRYDQAVRDASEISRGAIPVSLLLAGVDVPKIIADFAVALCLLDSFEIEGMPVGSRAQWRPDQVPITVMVWVKETVFEDFLKSFKVPKNS